MFYQLPEQRASGPSLHKEEGENTAYLCGYSRVLSQSFQWGMSIALSHSQHMLWLVSWLQHFFPCVQPMYECCQSLQLFAEMPLTEGAELTS